MANEITTWQKNTYRDQIMLAVQQTKSVLEGAVRNDGQLRGVRSFFDLLGSTTMRKRTVRNQPTVLTEQVHTRRSCSMDLYDLHMPVDKLDLHRIGKDPSSAYTQNGIAAVQRKKDEIIIAAFDGTAFEGETGSTASAFDTANYLIANGGTGLTKDKIIEAKKKFFANDVDMNEKLYWVYGPEQLEDLLNITEFTSSDFTTKALQDGKITYVMGFNWLPSNLLGVGAVTGTRRNFAWAASGVGFQLGQNMEVEINTRPDLSNIKQISIDIDLGAVRVEDKKVLAIDCVE